jgi:hypothetical protein
MYAFNRVPPNTETRETFFKSNCMAIKVYFEKGDFDQWKVSFEIGGKDNQKTNWRYWKSLDIFDDIEYVFSEQNTIVVVLISLY